MRAGARRTPAGLPRIEDGATDRVALEGAPALKGLKSVVQLCMEKGDAPLPENTAVTPSSVIALRSGLKPDGVREGAF